jgi:hypothetical protein
LKTWWFRGNKQPQDERNTALQAEGAVKDSVIKLNYIFTISEQMVYKVSFHLSQEKKCLIFNELARRLGELKG